MRDTGVYWTLVYNVLECPQMTVWIVNARHIKYVPGHKTDRKDSIWIYKLLLTGLLKPSYIPERELCDNPLLQQVDTACCFGEKSYRTYLGGLQHQAFQRNEPS